MRDTPETSALRGRLIQPAQIQGLGPMVHDPPKSLEKPRTIGQALNDLDGAIDRLSAISSEFMLRLTPVCATPDNDDKPGSATPPYSAPMAERIHRAELNVTSITLILADVLRRLEV